MITDERITELWNLASNTATSKPDWTYSEIIFATVRAVIAEHDAELRKQEPVAYTFKQEGSPAYTNNPSFMKLNTQYVYEPLYAAPIPPEPTPSQQEAQWQPIETAPRDGRLMIAHNLIMNSTYVVGWDARNKDDGPHWSDVPNRNAAESLWFNGAYFSHWMPLPTRPDEVTK